MSQHTFAFFETISFSLPFPFFRSVDPRQFDLPPTGSELEEYFGLTFGPKTGLTEDTDQDQDVSKTNPVPATQRAGQPNLHHGW